MESKPIKARRVCHEPIKVQVISKKQPIGVKLVKGGIGGAVDLSPIKNELADIRQLISSQADALTRIDGDKVNAAQVQAMLDNIVMPEPVDLTPINKQLEALDNRIDSTNKAINNLPTPISEARVQELIDAALPDLHSWNERLRTAEAKANDLNDALARINADLSDDIYYLKESIKYFTTTEQVQNIIITTVGGDIDNLKRNYNDMFDEIDMANRSISQIKTNMLTQAQVQSLIDTAIANIVDGEEVRY